MAGPCHAAGLASMVSLVMNFAKHIEGVDFLPWLGGWASSGDRVWWRQRKANPSLHQLCAIYHDKLTTNEVVAPPLCLQITIEYVGATQGPSYSVKCTLTEPGQPTVLCPGFSSALFTYNPNLVFTYPLSSVGEYTFKLCGSDPVSVSFLSLSDTSLLVVRHCKSQEDMC